MAEVRYLGWEDRDSREDSGGVMPAQLKRGIPLPDGGRITFRGRSGRPSQWRTVEDKDLLGQFREHPDYEVRNS